MLGRLDCNVPTMAWFISARVLALPSTMSQSSLFCAQCHWGERVRLRDATGLRWDLRAPKQSLVRGPPTLTPSCPQQMQHAGPGVERSAEKAVIASCQSKQSTWTRRDAVARSISERAAPAECAQFLGTLPSLGTLTRSHGAVRSARCTIVVTDTGVLSSKAATFSAARRSNPV